MRSRGHVPVGRLRLIEGEYLIEYRLNAACRYGAAHRLKHLQACTLARRAKTAAALAVVSPRSTFLGKLGAQNLQATSSSRRAVFP
jgi:hypothetical protein